ncbi:MAG: hypothetical protein K1X51_13760 [Rhodospirillaceae bacterium]|nr:hypothetical protein [Rhodospirillaceae bacterium]
MGLIVSYDDKFAMPSAEIELASGEHVLLTLQKHGLVIKALARPGAPERILFEAAPYVVADICAALLGGTDSAETTPLKILTAATVRLPDAAAVQHAFQMAAEA